MQLSEELRSFLEEVSFAALCVAFDLGHGPEAVVVVKSTSDALSGLRDANAAVEAGWVVDGTAQGPLVCLVIRVAAPGAGELLGEIYFDPSNPADLEMLGHFGRQDALRAVFLDEEVGVSWSASIPWDEVRRLEAEQVLDRAQELLEKAGGCDFEAARILFQEAVPLNRLVSRAFGSEGA